MKAVKFLFNADLRGGHDNLTIQAKKVGVDLNALSEIARAFDRHGVLDYNKALKASLLQRLAVRRGLTGLTKNDVIE